MAKSRPYWQERFEMLNEAELLKGEEYYKDLERIYSSTLKSIEKDINIWFGRFADNNGITYAEAKKWLKTKELDEFSWDVKEYIKRGKENAITAGWMKELENASARVHISRLESIKIQMQQQIEQLYGGYLEGAEKLMKDVYESAYYHTAFEIQAGYSVGYTLHSINKTHLQQVISKPWTLDGQTFSARIWKNKQDLINTLHTELTQSIIRGDSPKKLIGTFAKKFDVSRKQAGRLIMTEAAFFSSAAQKSAFNALDVERFEIVSTLDLKTSSICQDLDGKVFAMADYAPGITAPPFHPWCRTVTVPFFDDEYGKRIARGNDGKVHYIKSNIKYPEWHERFVA